MKPLSGKVAVVTGKVWVGAALAQKYGIEDIDGKHPRPMTLEEASIMATVTGNL